MKYSEAKEQIKALSEKYDVDMNDGDFNITYNGIISSIYVSYGYRYSLNIGNRNEFSNMPFSNKLYMILSELATTPPDERAEVKKYYVNIFGGELGYLNIDILTGNIAAGSVRETNFIKTKLTNKEIEQLKQRDDIPLDWDKVELEEVE